MKLRYSSVLLALVATSCATTGDGLSDNERRARMLGLEVRSDAEIEEYDLDGDGTADVRKFFNLVGGDEPNAPRKRQIAKRELDMNNDGAIDMHQHFNPDGDVVREVMDLDFDGKFDATDYYDKGVLYKREQVLNFHERLSVWKYYEKGQLIRSERDDSGNGRADTFQYYERGQLVRIGYDRDGDGKPDDYTEAEGTRTSPSGAKAKSEPQADAAKPGEGDEQRGTSAEKNPGGNKTEGGQGANTPDKSAKGEPSQPKDGP